MKRYIKSAVILPNDEPEDTRFSWAVSSTDSRLLKELANDPSVNNRTMLAYNINCPPEVLAQLSTDPEMSVRYEVAMNPNTPEEVLSQLLHSPDADTSLYNRLIKNNNISDDLLLELSYVNDRHALVKLLQMKGDRLPIERLKELLNHGDGQVAYWASYVLRNCFD